MTDKEQYDLACAESLKITRFIDRPRCVNCDHFQETAGTCGARAGAAVPAEYQHKPDNGCELWDFMIPF